jgi:hypothetical protein
MRRRAAAVVIGVDGVSDFNALHSGKHNEKVQLCASDVFALDGDDSCRQESVQRRLGASRGPCAERTKRVRSSGSNRASSASKTTSVCYQSEADKASICAMLELSGLLLLLALPRGIEPLFQP